VSYLLDTNVLSEFQRPRPDDNVLSWLEAVDEDGVYISVVSLGELRRGVALLAPGRRGTELDAWLREHLRPRFEGRILDITPSVAEAWGELMAQSKRIGVGLHVVDAFLAASAQVHSLNLVTRNIKDFEAFDLEITNPWAPP
jgi:predicted nucleic acid-binding protein